MSTNGYDSWAVDLANVGAVYPFQGSEMILAIVGIVLWLGWHVVQLIAEKREHDAIVKDYKQHVKSAIDDNG